MSVLENVLVAMHNSMNVNIIDIIFKTKNFKKEEKLKGKKQKSYLSILGWLNISIIEHPHFLMATKGDWKLQEL